MTTTAPPPSAGAAPLAAHPSITQMVSHLKTSISALEERIQRSSVAPHTGPVHREPPVHRPSAAGSARTSRHASAAPSPRPSFSGGAAPPRRPRNRESMHGEATAPADAPAGLGRAMASAMARAAGEQRFHAVRDSVNGELLDRSASPPPRPMADSRNTLTVEEQEQLLSNVSMDSVDWEAAGVPQGFRRLRSPRAHPTRPDTAARRAQAQIDRLPLLFADHFDGHITDLRELLDADVWADVQRSVDWQDWTPEERRAALSQVLVPRDRGEVLNEAEFADQGPNKPRQIALRGPGKAAALGAMAAALRRTASHGSDENSPLAWALSRSESAASGGSGGGRAKRGRAASVHGEAVQASCKGISSKAHEERRKLTVREAEALIEELRAAASRDERSERVEPRIVRELLLQGPAPPDPRASADVPKFAHTSETIWEDIDAQVAESLRQAAEQPKIQDLVAATEAAVYRKSQMRHYAWLASRVFGQHVAATRLQAAWRRYRTRAWYVGYRKTEEFNRKQAEYERLERERLLREAAEAEERAAARAARRKAADDRAHQERHASNVYKARSRYMESADTAARRAVKTAAREALSPYQRKEEGRRHLEQSKTLSRTAEGSAAASTTAASVISEGSGAEPAPASAPLTEESLLSAEGVFRALGINANDPFLATRFKSFGSSARRAGSDAASVGGGSSRGGGGTPSVGRTSSYGGTSFTSRASGAVAARRAARESRDSWMRGAGSGEAEEKILDESLATGRLRERRRAREERREAAKRLAALRPEQRASVRSEDERASRRMAVMEQVLGAENASRFQEAMLRGGGAAQGGGPAEDGAAALPSLEAQRATLLERRMLPPICESPGVSQTGDSVSEAQSASLRAATPLQGSRSFTALGAALAQEAAGAARSGLSQAHSATGSVQTPRDGAGAGDSAAGSGDKQTPATASDGPFLASNGLEGSSDADAAGQSGSGGVERPQGLADAGNSGGHARRSEEQGSPRTRESSDEAQPAARSSCAARSDGGGTAERGGDAQAGGSEPFATIVSIRPAVGAAADEQQEHPLNAQSAFGVRTEPAAAGSADGAESTASAAPMELAPVSGRNASSSHTGFAASSGDDSAAGMQVAGVAISGRRSASRSPEGAGAAAAAAHSASSAARQHARVAVPGRDAPVPTAGAPAACSSRQIPAQVSTQSAPSAHRATSGCSPHSVASISAPAPRHQDSECGQFGLRPAEHTSVDSAGHAFEPHHAAQRPGSRCSSRAATPPTVHYDGRGGTSSACLGGPSSASASGRAGRSRAVGSGRESAGSHGDVGAADSASEASRGSTPEFRTTSTAQREGDCGPASDDDVGAEPQRSSAVTGDTSGPGAAQSELVSHALAQSGSLLLSPDSTASSMWRHEADAPPDVGLRAIGAPLHGSQQDGASARSGDHHQLSGALAIADAELQSGVFTIPTSTDAEPQSLRSAAEDASDAETPRSPHAGSPTSEWTHHGQAGEQRRSSAREGNASAHASDKAVLGDGRASAGAQAMSGDVHADVALCGAEQRCAPAFAAEHAGSQGWIDAAAAAAIALATGGSGPDASAASMHEQHVPQTAPQHTGPFDGTDGVHASLATRRAPSSLRRDALETHARLAEGAAAALSAETPAPPALRSLPDHAHASWLPADAAPESMLPAIRRTSSAAAAASAARGPLATLSLGEPLTPLPSLAHSSSGARRASSLAAAANAGLALASVPEDAAYTSSARAARRPSLQQQQQLQGALSVSGRLQRDLAGAASGFDQAALASVAGVPRGEQQLTVGPALPLQLAGRMTATIESQDAMLAQHRVVAERHRERIETVSDINEAIARLRRGHLVGIGERSRAPRAPEDLPEGSQLRRDPK